MHVRCVAHITNLIVTDGIKKVGESVKKIRAAVRYVRQSPSRLKKFKECAEFEKIESKKLQCLDVVTRWNSTYLMLETAQLFERAFERYGDQQTDMKQDLEGNVPDMFDWINARNLVMYLENFYHLTLNVSGTKYVTSNNFFHEISHIHSILNEMEVDADSSLNDMAKSMKEKYVKYWGKVEKMNMLIFVASILDPRNKMEYVDFVLRQMYGEVDGFKVARDVKDALFELFNEYKSILNAAASKYGSESGIQSENTSYSGKGKARSEVDGCKTKNHRYKSQFKKMRLENGGRDAKSELDRYLNEECEELDDENFDILMWWKTSSLRFPILSTMARDVLAVPLSTVASEFAFSTGGRVLDSFRSSLTPRIVQGLICTQDWFRGSTVEINVEESLEDLQAFESDLVKSGSESTIVDL